MSDIVQRDAKVPEGPAAASLLLEPLLHAAAGEGAEWVSLTLDYGQPLAPGAAVKVTTQVERATRSLVFVHGQVLAADGAMAASASAIFRR